MNVIEINVHLASHPFFQGMQREHLDFVSGCASFARFREGEFLLLEGQNADRFFLLREGQVALEATGGNRSAVTIETVSPGDVVGWSWLVPPYRWRFDARAVTPVAALALDARCLRQKCEDDPRFGYEMMRRFAEIITRRLLATRVQLLDVYQ